MSTELASPFKGRSQIAPAPTHSHDVSAGVSVSGGSAATPNSGSLHAHAGSRQLVENDMAQPPFGPMPSTSGDSENSEHLGGGGGGGGAHDDEELLSELRKQQHRSKKKKNDKTKFEVPQNGDVQSGPKEHQILDVMTSLHITRVGGKARARRLLAAQKSKEARENNTAKNNGLAFTSAMSTLANNLARTRTAATVAQDQLGKVSSFITGLFVTGEDEPLYSIMFKIIAMHSIIFAYLAVGSASLKALELSNEKSSLDEWSKQNAALMDTAYGASHGACTNFTPATSTACRKALDDLLEHHGSASTKQRALARQACKAGEATCGKMHYSFDYWHSWNCLFSTITTIGYGNIAPATPEGRAFLLIYSLIGFVLNGVTLTTMSTLINRFSTYLNTLIDLPLVSEQYENVFLISIATMAHVIFYSLIMMDTEGWDMPTSVYFSWVTFTTIGFGDYYPTNEGAKAVGGYARYIMINTIMTMTGLSILASLLGALADATTSSLKELFEHVAEDLGLKEDSSDDEEKTGTPKPYIAQLPRLPSNLDAGAHVALKPKVPKLAHRTRLPPVEKPALRPDGLPRLMSAKQNVDLPNLPSAFADEDTNRNNNNNNNNMNGIEFRPPSPVKTVASDEALSKLDVEA